VPLAYLEQSEVAIGFLAKALGGEGEGLGHLVDHLALRALHGRQAVLGRSRFHKCRHHMLHLHTTG
jgi:hypothetical protein